MKQCNYTKDDVNCRNPVFSKGRCRIHQIREITYQPYRQKETRGTATHDVAWLKAIRKKKKYGNTTQSFGGRKYDSKLEANVAEELEWRKKAGEIKEIIPQYKISLDVDGRHIANYYVDFKCIMADDSVEFFEAKGIVTEIFRIKWLLFQALLPKIEPFAKLHIIK